MSPVSKSNGKAGSLSIYKKKRNFKSTSEPSGEIQHSNKELKFVIQKHAASHLHYDFRLELDGVLKSWAVPKGPSLDPSVKRLAMMVEDHPYDYKDFEGKIPKGNYGAGEVIVWDQGTYHSLESNEFNKSEENLRNGLNKGDLKFVLKGKKVNGAFALVKIKSEDKSVWLLIKKKDEYATTEDITLKDRSVISNKKVEEIDSKPDLSDIPKSKMPHNIKPMLASLYNEPFDDKEWIFELKYDGYRAITEVQKGKVEIYSRKQTSFNEKFSAIAKELKGFTTDMVLDGEAVILDEYGKPSFQLMQNYHTQKLGQLVYYVFDLIYFDGHNFSNVELIKRKEFLKQILPQSNLIRYSDHFEEKGKDFYRAIEEQKLEGIVAKKKNSTYKQNKRTKEWLKIKTHLRQEAIICGFTKPKGSRKYFGSLVLGVYKDKELKYIGQSGGGFNDSLMKDLSYKLNKFVTDKSPFKEKVKANTPITWVKPKLICEVSFSEWTEEGYMRHPIFEGLREDKTVNEVMPEIPIKSNSNFLKKKEVIINKHKLILSNLDKVYWPDENYTKGDLINYYRSISKYILPYLKDRPESMRRNPNGIKGQSFFQKNVHNTAPEWAVTKEVFSESNDSVINYLICNDEATLVYMANLGCIEINPWFSRIPSLENPDYLVIDLDPEDISFDKVIEAALSVKEVLDEINVKSFCKTSGATGLHIYVPLKAKYDYDIAKEFAYIIARIVNSRIPEFTSIERSPSKRQKKVYLDYLQNRKGQTLAAPYSVRPYPGATVAAPLLWEEVKKGLSPSNFTIRNISDRLKDMGDIFKGVLGPGIDIHKCLKKLGHQKLFIDQK